MCVCVYIYPIIQGYNNMMEEFRQVASDNDFVKLVGKKPLEFQRSYLKFIDSLKYFKRSTVIDPQFYKLEYNILR